MIGYASPTATQQQQKRGAYSQTYELTDLLTYTAAGKEEVIWETIARTGREQIHII